MERSMVEHQRVIEAILAMDEAKAVRCMDAHVDTLRTDAVAMVEALTRADTIAAGGSTGTSRPTHG
jgi:DNA-binding GntR family transcriptional regulator